MINRKSPQKHVWRAKIVFLTADSHGTAEIIQATSKAKTVICRWQERFREQGAAGLWRMPVALHRPVLSKAGLQFNLD